MTALRGRMVIVAVAALLLVTGCAAEAGERVGEGLEGDAPVHDVPDEALPEGEAPEECHDAFPLAVFAPDIADVEMQPVEWPDPPAGVVLCATADAMDGSSETVSYATDIAIGDVFTHYESMLTGYETLRTGGDENGTGYDTLDGASTDLSFQIREHDGGFVLVFARGDTGG